MERNRKIAKPQPSTVVSDVIREPWAPWKGESRIASPELAYREQEKRTEDGLAARAVMASGAECRKER